MIFILFASAFLWVLSEIATILTFGTYIVHDYNIDLLESELNNSHLNSADPKIISLNYSKMKGNMITNTPCSLFFSYYISTLNGDYLIPRFSKCSKLIKNKFREYKSQSKGRPKY